MDIAAFSDAVVAGIPLLFGVIGLVQFAKNWAQLGKVLISYRWPLVLFSALASNSP